MKITGKYNFKELTSVDEIVELWQNNDLDERYIFEWDNVYEDLKVLIREIFPKVGKYIKLRAVSITTPNVPQYNLDNHIVGSELFGNMNIGIRKTRKSVALEFRGSGMKPYFKNGHAVFATLKDKTVPARLYIAVSAHEICIDFSQGDCNFAVYRKGDFRKHIEGKRVMNKIYKVPCKY